MRKKGVSAIVATVLIIMITVAAVAILWGFIIPTVKDSLKESTSEKAQITIESTGGYTTWDEVRQIARVQIKRGNDDVNLTGLDFTFVKSGSSVNKINNTVPQKNEVKIYEFNLSDFGKPEKVSVAPITSTGVGAPTSTSSTILNYSGGNSDDGTNGQVSCISGLNFDGEIVICNCTDLQNMNQNLSASYVLGKDIDCIDTKNWNCVSGVCSGFVPVGNNSGSNAFVGELEGNNFLIEDIFIYLPAVNYVGLFGEIQGNVSNVLLNNANVTGSAAVGSLVGYQSMGVISNVSSEGFVKGSFNVGGLVGNQGVGSIIHSSSSGFVFGGSLAGTGGLVGLQSNAGKILSSFSSCVVNGSSNVGGLVGAQGYAGIINNSFAVGNVTGSSKIGGLVGQQYFSSIYNSYSSARVIKLGTYVGEGGLVGDQFYTSNLINNSFAVGNVTGSGSFIGGALGQQSSGSNVSGVYWDINKTGKTICCGTGTCFGSCTAIQNNEAYFYSSANAPMNSWDFVNVWQENVGSYPTLR